MGIAQGQAQNRARAAPMPRAISGLLSTLAGDDPVATAIRAIKADQVSLRLQNEFYEKSKRPLETKQ